MKNSYAIKNSNNDLLILYRKHRAKKRLFVIILIPTVIVLIGITITFGSADIKFLDIYKIIFKKIFPSLLVDADLKTSELIIWKIRLPRTLMGVLVGLALGSSGAVMQVILKNTLADPYMLGISSAAGFGASLAIIFGIGFFSGPFLIIGNAFIFSLISTLLILIISLRKDSNSQMMILSGLALLFFFQALTTLIQYFGDSDAVKSAVFWTVGDLGKADWIDLKITTPIVIICYFLLIYKSSDLNVMNTGDESAQSLGINVRGTRIFTMIVCTIMVATVVSFTGTIGFIGLVSPHIVRMLVGSDNKVLVPSSGLVGAVFLVVADSIARTVLSPILLPVGAITAFLGVPLFGYLIIKRQGKSI